MQLQTLNYVEVSILKAEDGSSKGMPADIIERYRAGNNITPTYTEVQSFVSKMDFVINNPKKWIYANILGKCAMDAYDCNGVSVCLVDACVCVCWDVDAYLNLSAHACYVIHQYKLF